MIKCNNGKEKDVKVTEPCSSQNLLEKKRNFQSMKRAYLTEEEKTESE